MFDREFDIGAELQRAFDEGYEAGKTDRPTGDWIAYKGMQPPEFHGKHYCSNCYHAIHLASNGNVYNYCPNCGARMKGADDEAN
jgi:PHP family Zn ribbon phosphoesterase